MARNYPDSPAGHARAMRDADDAELKRLGHVVKWTRGHGVRWLRKDPGWRAWCERCGGVARVAYCGDGAGYRSYEEAMEKKFGSGPRRCTPGRGR